METILEKYWKKFDPITLFVLAIIWYNLNAKIDDVSKRLTVIETVLLLENRLPNHIVKEGICPKS